MAADYYVFLKGVTVTTGTNDTVIVNDGGDQTATLTAGTYFLRGDSASDDLMQEIEDQIESATGPSPAYADSSVTFDIDPSNAASTVVFNANASWTLKNTGTFAIGDVGWDSGDFPVASDGSDDITTTESSAFVWVAPEPPSADDLNVKANTVQNRTVGGQVYTSDQGGPYDDRSIAFVMLDKERVLTAENTDTSATFQTFWENVRGGDHFEVHKVTISSGTVLGALSSSTLVGTYVLDAGSASGFRPQRHSPGVALYSFSLSLLEYAA